MGGSHMIHSHGSALLVLGTRAYLFREASTRSYVESPHRPDISFVE